MVLAFLYWMDAMNAKQLAVAAGKRACDAEGLQFLDDTVVLTRLRLQRTANGSLAFYRQYRFEFASDGGNRYRGEISLSGRNFERIFLEPYRIP